VNILQEADRELERKLAEISARVEQLEKQLTTISTVKTSSHITQSNVEAGSHTSKGGKMIAFERFMKDGYVFLSDLAKSKSVKYPEKLYESIKHSAVESGVKLVEVKTDEDRILLKAEKWEEYKDKLAKIKSPDEREVFTALREDWERKLFTTLSKTGAIYFHAKNKEWVYDRTSIEELRGET